MAHSSSTVSMSNNLLPEPPRPGITYRTYEPNPHIMIAWPEQMSELAREEAAHHDHDDEDPAEVHQLHSWRNRFYHRRIWKLLKKIPVGGRLLEIGAGSGFDAEHLAGDYQLTLTDVSPETLNRLYQRMQAKESSVQESISYIAADGEALPFADKTFDGVYMVATFHHFPAPAKALDECRRVLKPGGRLVIGIEPNVLYFRPLKWVQKALYRITHTDPHHISKADAEMEGFSAGQFQLLLRRDQWEEVSIKPVWLLAGWLHYLLEFIYRTFRLKKRLRLPLPVEKAVVAIDEALFCIPGVRYLGWHWTVAGRKR